MVSNLSFIFRLIRQAPDWTRSITLVIACYIPSISVACRTDGLAVVWGECKVKTRAGEEKTG